MTNIEKSVPTVFQTTVDSYAKSPPTLWNPSVAGCWSLLFSPVFGAYLHMKNWEALGELDRAKKSKNWVIGSLACLTAILLLSAFLPDTKGADAFLRLSGFALVVSWYYSIGKFQQSYVTVRFGKNYVRRGWIKPLLTAVLAFLAFLLLVSVVAFAVQAVVGHA